MDTATQRTQAHALIDALPQDSLEIVIALMRKLTGFASHSAPNESNSVQSRSEAASLKNIRTLAGCFSACQSKDWKEEKLVRLEEKYH